MSQKFFIKYIKAGQAKGVKVVAGGAGLAGNAVVLDATSGTRYQLADVVTLISPKKIVMKRQGMDLHLALPEGDVDSPDIVIHGYFSATDVSLWGTSIDGETIAYDTHSLVSAPSSFDVFADKVLGLGQSTEQSSATVTLGGGGWGSWSGWTWAAGIGLVAAVGGGGGGGGGGGSSSDPQAVISNYSAAGSGAAPTLKNYTDLGVTLPTISGVADADVLGAMNALIASKAKADVSDAAKLNALALSLKNAYLKIIAEANGAASDATPGSDPTVADYASVSVVVSGETKALVLLNNAVSELAATDVNTVAKLKVLANTASDVMLIASGKTPAQTDAKLVAGLNALLNCTYVTDSNIAAIKVTIGATTDDGLQVDTVSDIKSIVALQSLKDYANAVNGAGVASPSLITYKDAGVKALANITATSANVDIDSTIVTSAMGNNWLLALNSALDKQSNGNNLTVEKIQSLADSYYRILSEADGSATTNVDVYPADDAKTDPTSTDYANIGATVGAAKSVDLLNDYVGRAQKAAVDTVDEINVIARAARNVMREAGLAEPSTEQLYSTDAEWISGLNALLGLDTSNGVNNGNIGAVKIKIQEGRTGDAVDTVGEIKNLINPVIALQSLKDYANAVNGAGVASPSLITYKDAGVKALANITATSANVDIDSTIVTSAMGNNWLLALNSALDKQSNGNNLTVEKIQSLADSYYRILSEADGSATTNVDVYPADDAKTDPTSTDYANIGATVGAAKSVDLLNDYVGRAQKAAVDTVDEINVIARAARNVMREAGLAEPSTEQLYSTDAEWISGLNALLGLDTSNGVNNGNIGAVKIKIQEGRTGDAVDTVQELLSTLSGIRLQNFTDDTGNYFATGDSNANTKSTDTNLLPSLNDWAQFGVKANTSLSNNSSIAINEAEYWQTTNSTNGLMALNSALDKRTGTGSVSLDTMQEIADSYGRILQEADDGGRASNVNVSQVAVKSGNSLLGGDVVVPDLINVGLDAEGTQHGSTASDTGLYYLYTGDLLASSIGSLTSTKVDTVQELTQLAGYAQNVMKQAAGSSVTYTDQQWVQALTGLGIVGASYVSSYNNIAKIKSTILATADTGLEVSTWDQLQSIVSLVRMDDYASSANGSTAPVLADYQAILAADGGDYMNAVVTNPSYLSAFNTVIAGWDSLAHATADQISSSRSTVSKMVKSYAAILKSADGASTGPLFGSSGERDEMLNDVLGAGVVVSHRNDAGTKQITANTFGDAFSDIISNLPNANVSTVNQLIQLNNSLSKIFDIACEKLTPTSAGLTQTDLALLGFVTPGGKSPNDANYGLSSTQVTNFCESLYRSGASMEDGTAINSYVNIQNFLNSSVMSSGYVI